MHPKIGRSDGRGEGAVFYVREMESACKSGARACCGSDAPERAAKVAGSAPKAPEVSGRGAIWAMFNCGSALGAQWCLDGASVGQCEVPAAGAASAWIGEAEPMASHPKVLPMGNSTAKASSSPRNRFTRAPPFGSGENCWLRNQRYKCQLCIGCESGSDTMPTTCPVQSVHGPRHRLGGWKS